MSQNQERGVYTHTSNPAPILALLKTHLPYSLPLLRRIQFMSFQGGKTETSCILASFDIGAVPRGRISDEKERLEEEEVFTIAYLDFDRGPETEMWIYCSVEYGSTPPPFPFPLPDSYSSPLIATTTTTPTTTSTSTNVTNMTTMDENKKNRKSNREAEIETATQLLALLTHVSSLAREFSVARGITRVFENEVLAGSVSEVVVGILESLDHFPNPDPKPKKTPSLSKETARANGGLGGRFGRGVIKALTVPNYKFIFSPHNLPAEKELSEGYEWGVVRESELEMVLSRTDIPRKIRTMKLLPSAAIRLSTSQEIVAWGFLGADASLTTLHCEPEHRNRGLARAIAQRLFSQTIGLYANAGEDARAERSKEGEGEEPINHADVITTNLASQAVCTSLGGERTWIVYWILIHLPPLPTSAK